MANFKVVYHIKDGVLTRQEIRKPQAPRPKHVLLGHVAVTMRTLYKAHYMALRLGNRWGVYSTDCPTPLREFDLEDQAIMYLIAWEARHAVT